MPQQSEHEDSDSSCSEDTDYHLEFLDKIDKDLIREPLDKKGRIRARQLLNRSRVRKMKTLDIAKFDRIERNKNKAIGKIFNHNIKRSFMIPDV